MSRVAGGGVAGDSSIRVDTKFLFNRTGRPEKDRQNRTGRTGQLEQDSKNRKEKAGQEKWDRRNRAGRTG
jgi:hypothetical protein